MPTYEYACRSCGEHLEVVQSFRDEPLTECPTCGGALRKVFSPVGISFKGSGFYRNDSRSSAKRAKDGAAESTESKSTDSKSTDSKAKESTGTEPKESKRTEKRDTKSEVKSA
jgi:putative FmdB family regulatory protein